MQNKSPLTIDQLRTFAFMGASILAGAARELYSLADSSGDEEHLAQCMYEMFNENVGLRLFLETVSSDFGPGYRAAEAETPAEAAE